jgi:hypothetical protein
MAQDPEGFEDDEDCELETSVNPSHSLDMVALYQSSAVDSGMEADIIRGILDSHGIPSLVLGAVGYPSLGFQVKVHRASLREAERLIEEAKDAGPAAAVEAERAFEEGR